MDGTRCGWLIAMAVVACGGGSSEHAPADATPIAPIPATLRETGLGTLTVRPFTPQYPLWTDGAKKQRWIYLPPGMAIDGSNPDGWQFPVGTKLWKEFAFAGRPAETRYMERTREGWRYATYVWNAAGTEATHAPAAGTAVEAAVAPGRPHRVPSEADCRVCHGNGPSPVLGFSALQLSSDRDPHALHRETEAPDALDLDDLIDSGLLGDYPAHLRAPRIAARSAIERTALGYLHGNCGSCHRAEGPLASLGMQLAYTLSTPTASAGHAPAIDTTRSVSSHFVPPGAIHPLPRIAPGAPDRSVLLARVRSRDALVQMPPFGSQLVDDDAARLLESWIRQLP